MKNLSKISLLALTLLVTLGLGASTAEPAPAVADRCSAAALVAEAASPETVTPSGELDRILAETPLGEAQEMGGYVGYCSNNCQSCRVRNEFDLGNCPLYMGSPQACLPQCL